MHGDEKPVREGDSSGTGIRGISECWVEEEMFEREVRGDKTDDGKAAPDLKDGT